MTSLYPHQTLRARREETCDKRLGSTPNPSRKLGKGQMTSL